MPQLLSLGTAATEARMTRTCAVQQEEPLQEASTLQLESSPCLLLLLPSHFSRVQLSDPIDGSLPGSPVPEILQARTLEWVAISFFNA